MIVKRFADGSYLEYASGRFDAWCVYMVNPAKKFRAPPLDTQYFTFLQNQADTFGDKVYADFVLIYDATSKEVEPSVLSLIEQIAATYGDKAVEFSKIYTILYMAMIAEERKAFTRLGKRIKRLGVHKLLIEKVNVNEAANFMRGMGWRQIDAMCKERGF